MSTKFYKAEKGSELPKNYKDYLDNSKIIEECVRTFRDEFNITQPICPFNDGIALTEDSGLDEEVLTQLKVWDSRGLIVFKKRSPIHKFWVKLLKERSNGVGMLRFPGCFNTVEIYGHFSECFNMIADILYFKVHGTPNKLLVDDVKEIPGSEYYKVMEAEQAKQAAEAE